MEYKNFNTCTVYTRAAAVIYNEMATLTNIAWRSMVSNYQKEYCNSYVRCVDSNITVAGKVVVASPQPQPQLTTSANEQDDLVVSSVSSPITVSANYIKQ